MRVDMIDKNRTLEAMDGMRRWYSKYHVAWRQALLGLLLLVIGIAVGDITGRLPVIEVAASVCGVAAFLDSMISLP